MADLMSVPFWHCKSAEDFEVKVLGKNGVYFVRFNRNHKQEGIQFDWSCTCPAYLHHPGYCKHIKEIQKRKLRCGWMQFIDGGEPTKDTDGKKVCPRCGGPIESRLWGV